MTWAYSVEAVVLGLILVCLGLFTFERRDAGPDRDRAPSGIFSNPYLRLVAILLMVLVALRAGHEAGLASLPAIVALTIGTTVAGADFILLLTAILRGDKEYVGAHFKLEAAKARLAAKTAVVNQTPPKPLPVDESPAGAAVTKHPPSRRGGGQRPEAAIPAQTSLDPVLTRGPTAALRLAELRQEAQGTVRVAILGTGLPPELARHSALSQLEMVELVPGPVDSPIGATAVGLTLAAVPRAEVLLVGVIDRGYSSDEAVLLEGLGRAVAWGPQVILLDFGSPKPPLALIEAVSRLADVLLIAPAGNDSGRGPTWPAADEHVLGVAATTSTGELAPFSSFGRTICTAAPGVDVVGLAGVREEVLTYSKLSGTTASASIATAVAALALASVAGTETERLRDAICSTGPAVPRTRGMRALDPSAIIARLRSA